MVARRRTGRWFKSSRPTIKYKKIKFLYYFANIQDAKKIANFLLKDNDALCVNLIKNIDSFYLENNKIQNEKEVAILIKTCDTKSDRKKIKNSQI